MAVSCFLLCQKTIIPFRVKLLPNWEKYSKFLEEMISELKAKIAQVILLL